MGVAHLSADSKSVVDTTSLELHLEPECTFAVVQLELELFLGMEHILLV